MKKWVALMVAFNLFDAITTIYVISTALDVESNPLVQYLYGFHPLLWLVVKFLLVFVGSVAALSHPAPSTRLTYIAVTVFYGLLSIYQTAVLYFLLKG